MANNTDTNTQVRDALLTLVTTLTNDSKSTETAPVPTEPASTEPAAAAATASATPSTVVQPNVPPTGNLLADLARFLPPVSQNCVRNLDPAVINQLSAQNQQSKFILGSLIVDGAAYGKHRKEMLALCLKHGKSDCKNGHIAVDLPPAVNTSQYFSYTNSSSQSVSIEQIRFSLGIDKLSVGFSKDSVEAQNEQHLEFIVSNDMALIPAVGCVFCLMRVDGVPSRANAEVKFRSAEDYETFMNKRRQRQLNNIS